MSKAGKYIIEHTRNCSNLMQVPTLDDKGNIVPKAHPWLTPDDARKAVEIAREEICEWLLNHNDYITVNGNITSYDMEKLVEDLKQAMNHE